MSAAIVPAAVPSLAIELRDVHKRYGAVHALAGLTCAVPRGTVTALVGPNGAGKSTTFAILCGFVHASAGDVRVLGQPPRAGALRGRLGALPQDALLGPDLSLRQHVTALGRQQGLRGAALDGARARVLKLVGLEDAADRKVGTFSHGMAKRAGVALAFLGAPELVLLDEPTAGLDPRQAASLREAIATERGQRTVVVSSHQLLELETLCDHVVLVDHGRAVAEGTMATLLLGARELRIVLGPGPAPTDAVGAALPGGKVRFVEADRTLFVQPPADMDPDEATALALRALLDAGARVRQVLPGTSLEQRYLQLTEAPDPPP